MVRRLICRYIGHDWKWIGGWIELECVRCGRTDDEHREDMKKKGLI